MQNPAEKEYKMPENIHQLYNMHIIIWLIKDICWCMTWKWPATFMIIPTLTLAILLVWKTRKDTSELVHNLAVIFWVIANATWMSTELFGEEDDLYLGFFKGHQLAMIPFVTGGLILLTYNLIIRPRAKRLQKIID